MCSEDRKAKLITNNTDHHMGIFWYSRFSMLTSLFLITSAPLSKRYILYVQLNTIGLLLQWCTFKHRQSVTLYDTLRNRLRITSRY